MGAIKLNDGSTLIENTPDNPVNDMEGNAITLAEVQKVFINYFEQLVDDCCNRIDVEFDYQFGKNREQFNKDLYKELLGYLRSERAKIKQNFLHGLKSSFKEYQELCEGAKEEKRKKGLSLETASLIEDEQVEVDHVIKMMIRNCKENYREELLILDNHLAGLFGKHSISSHINPVSPEKLVRALEKSLNFLQINAESKVALYRTFDSNVLKQIGFIYQELNDLFNTSQISDQIETPETADVKEESVPGEIKTIPEAFIKLQNQLKKWRERYSPSVFDMMPYVSDTVYDQYEVKNALQIIQQFAKHSNSTQHEEEKPLKWQVIKKLEEIDAGDNARAISREDEDALDLVALIFFSISHDSNIPDKVKDSIIRLDLPVATMAISDKSFFIDNRHPLRQLLHEICKAGCFLNLGEYSDRSICNQIEQLVERISIDEPKQSDVLNSLLKEFTISMAKIYQRSQILADREKQLLQNKENLEIAKLKVSEAIHISLERHAVPAKITKFVKEVWRDVLLLAYVRKQEEPEIWEDSLKVMDNLIASVIPPEGDDERKRLLKMLPGLVQSLRNGFNRISYDKHSQSRFFKELAVYHVILMDKKSTITTTEDELETGSEFQEDKNLLSGGIRDEYWRQANVMTSNKWFIFTEGAESKWGRLIWKSPKTGTLLFIGKNGSKISEINVDEFAEELRKGRMSLAEYDDSETVDKAFVELSKV